MQQSDAMVKGYDFYGVVDMEGRFLYVSPSHHELLGWENVIGEYSYNLCHPSDRGTLIQSINRKSRKYRSAIRRFRKSDGSYVALECQGFPIVENGKVKKVEVYSKFVEKKEVDLKGLMDFASML